MSMSKSKEQMAALQQSLSELRRFHADLGKACVLASILPQYQRFPGMLYMVEMMVEDTTISNDIAVSYVKALSTQLSLLINSTEISSWRNRSTEEKSVLFMETFLANLSERSK